MPDLIERQVALEIESVVMGRERYEERLKERGISDTSPGKEQIRRLIPTLAANIEEFLTEGAKRAGKRHSAIPFLANIAPSEAAYLSVRYALDGAMRAMTANTCALRLGNAVQDHINLLSMAHGDNTETDEEQKHMKRLFAKVLKQVEKATTEAHRAGVWHHVLKKYRPESLVWSDSNKLQVGIKLLEIVESTAGLITLKRMTQSRHDTPVHVVFTEEAQAWFDEAHMRSSLFEPVHQPMLVRPRDWSTPFNGGYITGAIRQKMVATYSQGVLDELRNWHMPAVYDAVNAVQSTPWRINKSVLNVMREVRALGVKYRALFVELADDVPPRPAGITKETKAADLSPDQKEELMLWKRTAARAHAGKAKERALLAVVAQKMAVAQKFSNEEALYFPHYLDFRGRIYPVANYLNPQGDDVARGMLEFAEGKPLGERGWYWLCVHIANLFGVDKVSFDERVKWVEDNGEKLMRCASSPLDEDFWMTADSPWQALAACFEYLGGIVQGEEYVSHLPVAMDGSCSGLQHFSAMLLDEEGGAQVNLVPADQPADIYTAVANKAQALSNSSTSGEGSVWADKVVRKIAKQPTMTYCYSASLYGMAGQIETAVRKFGRDYLGEGVETRQPCVYMASVVRRAIGETVVAAKSAMDFLQQVAVLAAEHELPIRWTSPAGFPVVQEYRQALGQRIEIMYRGVRLRLMVRRDGSKIDKKRQAAGVAPNFVHACDSAHLMSTVNLGMENGLTSWACIHDSFGVHASDVDTLHAVIRESFIEQYTPNVLEKFREEIIEQMTHVAPELIEKVPPVPQRGNLDLASVREAAYFFA